MIDGKKMQDGNCRDLGIKTVLILASGMLLSYLIVYYYLLAYQSSLNFNGYPFDGPFQLFNGLRRLSAGQIPGQDFQFFHGLGTLLMHYPFYQFLGTNLFASEFSRQFLSPILFIISSSIFFYATTRRIELATSLTVIMVLLASVFFPSVLDPGNSLLGVRSMFPILVASAMMLDAPVVILSLLLALAFFISIEHGIAALLAFAIVTRRRGFLTLAASLPFILVLYILASGQSFLQPLRYELVDIPGDQFWYFGVPPVPFFDSIGSVLNCSWLILPNVITLVLLALFLKIKHSHATLFLLIYALLTNVSLLAIENPVYLDPMKRVDCMLILLLLAQFSKSIFQDYYAKGRKYAEIVSAATMLLLVIAIVGVPSVANILNMSDIDRSEPHLGVYLSPYWSGHLHSVENITGVGYTVTAYDLTDSNWDRGIGRNWAGFFVSHNTMLKIGDRVGMRSGPRVIENVMNFGPYTNIYLNGSPLDPGVDGYPQPIIVNRNIAVNDSLIWSTYSSLPEAEMGIFNPATDYIIHALGSSRERYAEIFKKTRPLFVRTENKGNFSFSEWLMAENWVFYRELLTNYSIVYTDTFSVLWKLQDLSYQENPWNAGNNFPAGNILEVNLKYELHNPWAGVPLFGQLPRWLIVPENCSSNQPVSLPPDKNEIRFMFRPLKDARLNMKVMPTLPGVSFDIKEVKYRILNTTTENANYLVRD